jgi:acetyl esterase/lipase
MFDFATVGTMADDRWTRRDFLRTSVLGASAVAFGACSSGLGIKPQSFVREKIPYGSELSQVGELTVELGPKVRPVAVLIHGGYWQMGFDRSEMDELADDLARHGYASWNMDYRRIGEPGGGWSGTFTDVALGFDALANLAPVKGFDLNRVVVVGHSAGAQLSAWLASRARIPAGDLGSSPKVLPKALVSMAGVLDMVASAQPAPGDTEADRHRAELPAAVNAVMAGSPDQLPARYASFSPIALLPLGIPQLLLHGRLDDRVSIDQSRAYLAAAEAVGDQVKLIELPNVDHFDILKTTKGGWDEVVTWLGTIVGDPAG